MNSRGIDVSVHNGNINWNKVKEAGVDFVIIRAGYGKNSVDKTFKANIEGALKAGLKVGAYWFVYALKKAEIGQNAKAFKDALDPYKGKITMKVWCDLEYDSDSYCAKHGVNLSKAARTEWVKEFCDIMKAYGYDCGVYANPDYLKNKLGDVSKYSLWLARYSSSKGSYQPFMWQYSSKGSIAGIKGNVDMNICYADSGQKNNPYPVPTRTLKKRIPMMKGDDVKWLQAELGISVDGKFGNQTKTAVLAYQRAHGLTVDGAVGAKTRYSLLND